MISNEGDTYTAHAVVGKRLLTLNLDESVDLCLFHSYVDAKQMLPG
jgi:hypothetical protein